MRRAGQITSALSETADNLTTTRYDVRKHSRPIIMAM